MEFENNLTLKKNISFSDYIFVFAHIAIFLVNIQICSLKFAV